MNNDNSKAATTTQPRVWFITGASRGFGALIAEQALAAGDAVASSGAAPWARIASPTSTSTGTPSSAVPVKKLA